MNKILLALMSAMAVIALASMPVMADVAPDGKCGEGKCADGKCGQGKCASGKCGGK